ncbi:hypothetical protein N5079_17985 [Planotetraspora sp. A-T 1434]|uniref:hypothetical protein n=1 Tax=Planotetraspora sp. A-T 1434 TaxID=2979219 RepID=UPI0021C17870|nr:hypothetical protein [Planotetraspora sp. A-T 1434]MCT9932096.1 hypothetical protein [Planotetraspora sp. A-T 1434]
MRTTRRIAAIAATVLTLTVSAPALAVTGASDPVPVKPQGGTLDPHKVRWESAKPIRHGRYLRITWTSGIAPCWVLDRVRVKETSRKVTVTLYEGHTKDAGMCVLIAVRKTTTVRLKTPLGHRHVVDGARR